MKTGLAANKSVQPQTSSANQKIAAVREELGIPRVSIQGYHYLVDLGETYTPRLHRVNKSKECSCDAPYCEAIETVRRYLQAGGMRAPDPEGLPLCPICGGKTYHDRKWDGKYTKSLGWRCEKGGLGHFLEAKARRIQRQFARNPWLFPPVKGYPGLRRDELISWEACQAAFDRIPTPE